MSCSARNTRRNSIVRNGLMASSAILAVAIMPQAAFAQAAPPAAEGEVTSGDEIIVTARKQYETLQEVPVTISVVTGKTLEDYHVNHVEDVASHVPGLNVQVGGSGSGGTLSLRGVGSSAISASFDSAVAFDLDGVQVSTMRLVQSGFFDVGQIEVLKGPQSLYYGKSASAGVLSLKSAEPTKTWEFAAKGSYEFIEKGKVFGGYISGPLSDTIGIRLAAQYTDIDRYQRLQKGTPAVNNPRGLKDIVARGTINWQPQDRFTANLKFQYVHDENDGAISQSEVSCGANGRADEIVLLGNGTPQLPFLLAIPAGYDCNTKDGRYFLPDANPALAKSVPLPSKAAGFNGVPFGVSNLYFGRLRFDLDVTDALKITAVSGYVNLDATDVDSYSYGGVGPIFSPLANLLKIPLAPFLQNALGFTPAFLANNAAGTPSGVGSSDPRNALKQYSQEIRLASNFDGPLNFLIGGFFENRKFIFDTSQQAANVSLLAPDPITGYTFDYKKVHTTKTDAASIFGSLTYKPNEQLEISGGVRYTDEKKINTIRVPYVHAFLAASPAFLKSGFYSGPIKFKDNNFSPEATIKYKITPDINIFASYKTGFKSGGIDNSALPTNSLSQAALSGNFGSLIYKSEKASGGEIGFKSQLAGRSLTLNGTAFYYKFKDLQVQTFNATTIQFVTQNAGAVTTKGVDLEARWRTPLQGLNFSTALAYLDGKYSKDFFNPGADGLAGTADDINLKGRKVSRAPKFSGNVAFDYTAPVGDSLTFQAGGNMSFSSRYFTNNTSPADYVQRAWTTFDGRISFGDREDHWRIALVGVNIADRVITQTSGGRPFLAPANGFGVPVGDDVVLNQNRGRQVFVEASVKF